MKAGAYDEAGTGLATAPAAPQRPAYVPVVQAEPMLREFGGWPAHLDGKGYREDTVDLAAVHPDLACGHCLRSVSGHTWRVLGRDARTLDCSESYRLRQPRAVR